MISMLILPMAGCSETTLQHHTSDKLGELFTPFLLEIGDAGYILVECLSPVRHVCMQMSAAMIA